MRRSPSSDPVALPSASGRDLRGDVSNARPIYHHKHQSIDAHLTVVFAPLAVSHLIENHTGWSIKKLVRTARATTLPTLSATVKSSAAVSKMAHQVAK
jgi:hypothetical protein